MQEMLECGKTDCDVIENVGTNSLVPKKHLPGRSWLDGRMHGPRTCIPPHSLQIRHLQNLCVKKMPAYSFWNFKHRLPPSPKGYALRNQTIIYLLGINGHEQETINLFHRKQIIFL